MTQPLLAPAQPGMIIASKFTLLRTIGEGAAGMVFEAEDTVMERRVALKVLHPHVASHPELLSRFRREAQAAAGIEHPNIVTVHELGQRHDGSFYIVQELLRGKNLRERLGDGRKIPALAALDIAVPIMGALVAAHARGVVHRDIKPENIFLARSTFGETVPKLIDFGIAKMTAGDAKHATRAGALWGTVAYMSPEQARGIGEIDARTDVWAMGVVLHELLAGVHPFDAPSEADTLLRIIHEPVPKLPRTEGAAPGLAAVVARALERDLDRRYPSMEAMLAELLDAAVDVDPALAARHARSIPRFDGDRTTKAETMPPPALGAEAERPDEPPTGELHLLFSTHQRGTLAGVAKLPSVPPPVLDEMDEIVEDDAPVDEGEGARVPTPLEARAEAAQHALGANALEHAVALAEEVLASPDVDAELSARMGLVVAIACFWLGRYVDAERAAMKAAQLLPRGTTAWCAAISHQAMAGSYLAHDQQLTTLVFELLAARVDTQPSVAQSVTWCRLIVLLVRAGAVEFAQRVLTTAGADVGGTSEEPFVQAWSELVHAEFAAHAGDPARYLLHVETAVKAFGASGDPRNACLQRVNVGSAHMQLGAYGRAEEVLREALAVAEPMRLSFLGPLKAKLGITLARLGRIDDALSMERAALAMCIQQGHQRFEAIARCYLATILRLAGRHQEAEDEAELAVETASAAPALRGYSLAAYAETLFQRDPLLALAPAQQAMDILYLLGGVEEGESLIRLTYARALDAADRTAEARARMDEAERRLLARAAKISDRQSRKAFLENVPENARTLTIAEAWNVLAQADDADDVDVPVE